MNRSVRLALGIMTIIVVTAGIEAAMGRLWLGPDGHFGFMETNIWSSEQSQRVIDPHSFSHFVHGFLFYGLLFLVMRRQPLTTRLLLAVALEASWEILENSPLIINRYRAVTIAQGYVGDSILNSMSDIAVCGLGFLAASRLGVLASVAMVVAIELIMLVLIRDNLTLNIVMLIAPMESIRLWQMAGH